MSTLTIQISDAGTIQFIEREAAQAGFADPSGYIEALLKEKQLAKRKAEIDAKLLEALDAYERGEYTDWHPGDCVKFAEQHYQQKSQKA